jgi:hypothetical protein
MVHAEAALGVFDLLYHRHSTNSLLSSISYLANGDFLPAACHNVCICSSERPLVSGTIPHMNKAARMLITP